MGIKLIVFIKIQLVPKLKKSHYGGKHNLRRTFALIIAVSRWRDVWPVCISVQVVLMLVTTNWMRWWRRLQAPSTSPSFWPCLERSSKVSLHDAIITWRPGEMFDFLLVPFCVSNTFHRSGTDPEETILNAFKVFDPEGKGILRGEEYAFSSPLTRTRVSGHAEIDTRFCSFSTIAPHNLHEQLWLRINVILGI